MLFIKTWITGCSLWDSICNMQYLKNQNYNTITIRWVKCFIGWCFEVTLIDCMLFGRMAPEVIVTETCKDDPYDYKVSRYASWSYIPHVQIFHTEFREAVNVLTRLLHVKSQMNKSQDLIYLYFCMSCVVLQEQFYINDN